MVVAYEGNVETESTTEWYEGERSVFDGGEWWAGDFWVWRD